MMVFVLVYVVGLHAVQFGNNWIKNMKKAYLKTINIDMGKKLTIYLCYHSKTPHHIPLDLL